jgi:hypothetical protein
LIWGQLTGSGERNDLYFPKTAILDGYSQEKKHDRYATEGPKAHSSLWRKAKKIKRRRKAHRLDETAPAGKSTGTRVARRPT